MNIVTNLSRTTSGILTDISWISIECVASIGNYIHINLRDVNA